MGAITNGWHIHENGGGQVSDLAIVEQSVFVARGARVAAYAIALDRCRILDEAQLGVEGLIQDEAELSGRALVAYGGSVVDRARVFDDAKVFDRSVVSDESQLGGRVILRRGATVTGLSRVIGDFTVLGAQMRDYVRIDELRN